MLRAFLNLFLIVIISITALGIPANGDTLNLSFKLNPPQKSTAYLLDVDASSLINPTTLEFHIKGESLKNSHELNNTFLLDIIKDNKTLSTIEADSFIKTTSSKGDPNNAFLHYSLDLSQKELDIPDGNYTFLLYSTSKELKDIEPLKLHVSYFTLSKYIPGKNEIDRDMMSLTLYFPHASHQYLIPITRFVKHTRAPLRTIVENLRKGSDSPLAFSSPIPEVARLQVKNDMVIVHLPKDLGAYNENPITGSVALESFVNSLTSVPGINRVKFLVDGKESKELFNGIGTEKIFSQDQNPKVYLGFNHDSRLLLVPKSIGVTNEKQLIEAITDTLKTGIFNGDKLPNLVPPIPENVSLMDFSNNNGTLTLNFSKEFLYGYADRIDLQRFMIDAILYSFSTLDGVEHIQIYVDNQTVDSFGGLDLSASLNMPKFINPEKE